MAYDSLTILTQYSFLSYKDTFSLAFDSFSKFNGENWLLNLINLKPVDPKCLPESSHLHKAIKFRYQEVNCESKVFLSNQFEDDNTSKEAYNPGYSL